VAAVDLEIVGAERDRHEGSLAWREAENCYMSLLHGTKQAASH